MTLLPSYKRASKSGIAMFSAAAICTLLVALWVSKNNQNVVNQELELVTEQVAENVINRITLYQYGLRGARGTILTAGDDLSRMSFQRYSMTRDVDAEFPGARGFGFIRRVLKQDEAAFVAKAKADGWPEFTVRHLNPNNGERYIIEYIEPVSRNRAAVGLDIASESNRQQAAQAAMLSGEVRLSGPITLVQATGNPLQSFLILMPVYGSAKTPPTAKQRNAQGYGWSYAPLVINEVLADLTLHQTNTKLVLTDVTDSQKRYAFFETHADDATPLSHFNITVEKEIFGRTWEVSVSAYPHFVSNMHLLRPSFVVLNGLIVSLLLAAVVTLSTYNRHRKQLVAADNARRANMLEHSLDAIISFDLEGLISSWNKGAENLFGYAQLDVIGRRGIEVIVPEQHRPTDLEQFKQVLSGRPVLNHISTHLRADGTEVSTAMTALAIYNEQGDIVGLSKTIRDITAQQDAERRILDLNTSLERQVTKRTQALEQAMLENKTLLDTINQQLLYSVTDAKGVIQEVNENFCRASGYSREQLLGHTHSMLRSNEHEDTFWQQMWHTINNGESWHGEVCNLDKQGKKHWFDTIVGPIFDEYGNIDRFVALRTDITERKFAQIEKNKLGSLLTNVLAAASEVAIIATDEKGLITIFNRGAEIALGYDAADLVGKSSPAIFHLADEVITRGEQLSKQYGQTIEGFEVFVHKARTEGPETRTWTYIRKDGSQFQVSLSVTAMHDTEGLLVGYLGIAINIDLMLKQQEALVSASSQLSKAAEVAELGIWSWSLEDNTLDWNERMFAMYDQPLSLRESGLSYEHWRMRVHPDDLTEAETKLHNAIAGTDVYDPIFRILTTDGSVRYIQAGAQISCDKYGMPTKVVGINRDITEQRELEQTLRFAKEQADAASASKSTFLANMSHEIRTPMNAVLGMLQLVMHTEMTAQQHDYISKTQTAAKSLLGLLNDILDFSKIDAGRLELDPHPCVLEEMMRDLSVVLSANQHTKDVEVIFDLDARLPKLVEVDRLRLQQIMINLAGNALKFTKQGHVMVSIASVKQTERETTLRISVTDTGIGISENQRDKIFTGFVQAESSTSRRFGGTGLGLAITKRLIELMDSTLNLTSTVGVGSCFWFELTLPILSDVSMDNSIDLSGKRLLVVDDSPIMLRVLQKTLTRHNATIVEANNGLKALEQVERSLENNQAFDAILMDWRMPELDGLHAAEKILSLTAQHRTPAIIMLTAYGKEAISESRAFSTQPFVNFLTKPVTSNLLLETVRDAIEGKKALSPDRRPVSQQLSGLKVLVVEDNLLNRQVIDELLSLQGASVTLADGGIAGVSQVVESGQRFDIVIMDMQMPDIDGLEATRRIRADGRFAELPILAMTANASSADRELCIQAGMNEHVGKPIDMDTLLPSILTLVGRQTQLTSATPIAEASSLSDSDDVLIENIDSILRRYAGDSAFFTDIKRSFAPEMTSLSSRLSHALALGDIKSAGAISHAMKGTAANFGAKKLAKVAANVEQACKQETASEAEVARLAAQLPSLIEASVEALDLLFPDAHAATIANDASQMSTAHLALDEQSDRIEADTTTVMNEKVKIKQSEIATLMTLLIEQNLEALALVETLVRREHESLHWQTLHQQINNLEFDKALTSLQKISSQEQSCS